MRVLEQCVAGAGVRGPKRLWLLVVGEEGVRSGQQRAGPGFPAAVAANCTTAA